MKVCWLSANSRPLPTGVILQHDNAAPHKARQTVEKVAMMGRELLPHPPYSADLAASDFQPFGPLKEFLGGLMPLSSDDLWNAENVMLQGDYFEK